MEVVMENMVFATVVLLCGVMLHLMRGVRAAVIWRRSPIACSISGRERAEMPVLISCEMSGPECCRHKAEKCEHSPQ